MYVGVDNAYVIYHGSCARIIEENPSVICRPIITCAKWSGRPERSARTGTRDGIRAFAVLRSVLRFHFYIPVETTATTRRPLFSIPSMRHRAERSSRLCASSPVFGSEVTRFRRKRCFRPRPSFETNEIVTEILVRFFHRPGYNIITSSSCCTDRSPQLSFDFVFSSSILPLSGTLY